METCHWLRGWSTRSNFASATWLQQRERACLRALRMLWTITPPSKLVSNHGDDFLIWKMGVHRVHETHYRLTITVGWSWPPGRKAKAGVRTDELLLAASLIYYKVLTVKMSMIFMRQVTNTGPMDSQRQKNNEASTTALEVEPQRNKLGPRRKFMQKNVGRVGRSRSWPYPACRQTRRLPSHTGGLRCRNTYIGFRTSLLDR